MSHETQQGNRMIVSKEGLDAFQDMLIAMRKQSDDTVAHLFSKLLLQRDTITDVVKELTEAAMPPEPVKPVVYEYLPPQKNVSATEKTALEGKGWIMYREEGHPINEEGIWDVMVIGYYRKPVLAPTAPTEDSAEADLPSVWEDALPDDDDGGPTEPITPVQDEPKKPPTLPEQIPDIGEAPTQPSPTQPDETPEPVEARTNPDNDPDVTRSFAEFAVLDDHVAASGCLAPITVSDAFEVQDIESIYHKAEPRQTPDFLGTLGYQPVRSIRLNDEYPNEYLVTYGPDKTAISLEGHHDLYILRPTNGEPDNDGLTPPAERMLIPAGPPVTITTPAITEPTISENGVVYSGPYVDVQATQAFARAFGGHAGKVLANG